MRLWTRLLVTASVAKTPRSQTKLLPCSVEYLVMPEIISSCFIHYPSALGREFSWLVVQCARTPANASRAQLLLGTRCDANEMNTTHNTGQKRVRTYRGEVRLPHRASTISARAPDLCRCALRCMTGGWTHCVVQPTRNSPVYTLSPTAATYVNPDGACSSL